MQWEIFPVPRKINTGTRHIRLSNTSKIIVQADFSAVFTGHVLNFCRDFRHMFKKRICVSRGFPQVVSSSENEQVLLVVRKIADKSRSGYYRLGIENNHLLLEAGTEAAAYYGLQSLHQIFSVHGTEFPAFELEDYPDFSVRGVMLDISRCKVPTLATLKDLIKLFSRLKINQLQLYIEHTFAFSAHEQVWADASPLTAEDILILDSYCTEHYMDMVPNFNSFGHFERWLKHPAYKHLAESPDGFRRESGEWVPEGSTLMPDKASLNFLETLYTEYLPNFSSRLFNVGLDETWELGKGRSREMCEKAGTIQVYTDFLRKIYQLVKQFDRRMLFWADIIIKEPSLIKVLPGDITACIWGYEADHPFAEQIKPFKDSGLPFYVCSGTSSWNALTGRTDNCLENIKQAAVHGHAAGAAGYQVTDWGDNGHHQYLPVSYPGFTAGAGYGWNSQPVEESAIAAAIDRIVFGGKAAGAGALLLELGRVHNVIPKKQPNETIINRLLFHSQGNPGVVKGITTEQLNACLERLQSLEDRFVQIRIDDASFNLVKEEYINTINMSRYALHKGLLLIKEQPGFSLPAELTHIVRMHEYLWLQRNCTGGLRESSDHIRDSLSG